MEFNAGMHPQVMKAIGANFLLLLICGCSLSFSRGPFTIKGRLIICEPYHKGNDFANRRLSLLKGKDTVVKNIKTRTGEFVVPGLEAGQYTLVFTNTFNQHLEKILLVLTDLEDVTCCTDSFVDPGGQTFIGKISAPDRIKLFFESTGCFHSVKSFIEIQKRDSTIIASFYSSGEKKMVTKVLTKSDREAVILFEKQLRQIKNLEGGCTTVDYYNYTANGKSMLQVKDSSCKWNGYFLLTRKLFGIKV